ncbi:MAG: protein kinase domain-containing protein, partial [Tepidisphaeraceae bacterium]
MADLPAPEQEATLLRLCGSDTEILAEVRELLGVARRHTVATNRFAETVDPTHTPDREELAASDIDQAPIEEKPGSHIGPFKLLQQLGEGGFGSVFMAEQQRPVHRKVALKIIKLGMDTRSVVARFEQERQALAMMDHPNIAKVFDAGVTSTGRPYF